MDTAVLKDKIFGCWLGKNVGGTIGAPVEGWKNSPCLPFEFPKQNEPNDDLDLQLLWLAMLRKKGLRFTHDDLMYAWGGTTFPYDEYGIARANIERGFRPPMTGTFNNFFSECMGCPIRSEVWAVVAAGKPRTAAYYAMLDATVDHDGESVYAEIFFAVMESLSFESSLSMDNILALIREALEYIPRASKVREGVEYVLDAHRSGVTLEDLRKELIRRYDRGNFSHCLINIPFTMAAMVYGECDFLRTMVLAANLGYDTDCTAATSGAMIGILAGAKALREKYHVAFDERIVTCGVTPDMLPEMPKNIGELTDWTFTLNQQLLAEQDLPGLDKGFTLPARSLGQLSLHRSFSVGIFDSYEQAMASDQWQICHTVSDVLDLSAFIRPGKTIFVRTKVKNPAHTKVRISPSTNGEQKVWINGRECGGNPKTDFTPSPHRSWAVKDFLTVPMDGVCVVSAIVSPETAPLFYTVLVAREDRTHEIHAEIRAN